MSVLEEQNKEILSLLKEKYPSTNKNSSCLACPVKLPIESVEGLEEVENNLKLENNLLRLVISEVLSMNKLNSIIF